MSPLPPLAVVGVGCRLPGGVRDLASLAELLVGGREAIGPMPSGRFDASRLAAPTARRRPWIATPEGGFLEGIDGFDAPFFGISPREARRMDPQQRLLLEVAWEALEDAGIVPSSLAGTRTGVWMGLWSGEYEQAVSRRLGDMDLYATTGSGRYAAAGRISFALDARGPSMTVDTACSSSLVALHLACSALRAGEADVALAGAANLILQPFVSVAYSRSGMLSPQARCRFGEPEPDGYVRSEGVAVVVLKRLHDAVRDRDPVHAVVLGSAVNSDGRGSERLVAPSTEAQQEMLREACRAAGVRPDEVDYVEAHGTGTRAGDLAELTALGQVLGRGRSRALPVGSIKRLIGHTEAASGMAGLLKALVALQRGRVPDGRHGTARNPDIPWAELGVEVAAGEVELPAPPRRAVVGVNSFGVTGTNAHVLLAAPSAGEKAGGGVRELEGASVGPGVGVGVETGVETGVRVGPGVGVETGVETGVGPGMGEGGAPAGPPTLVLAASGRTAAARDAAARNLLERVEGMAAGERLRDLAWTGMVRREHHLHRLAVTGSTAPEVADALRRYLAGEAVPQVATGEAAPDRSPRIAFVFSGQGSQWAGMAQSLRGRAPAFDALLARQDAWLQTHEGWSLLELLGEADSEALEEVSRVQPVLSCVQMALSEQLRAWGIEPVAVVGHSMGEVAAAHASGALSLEDALAVITSRSRLLAEVAGRGAMALVDLPEAEVRELLRQGSGGVSVAAVNGPRTTVVSGDPEAVDALLAGLEARGVFCRRVKVDVASHSAQVDPLLPRLRERLSTLEPRVAAVSFQSTVHPGGLPEAGLDADYWADNLRRPVRLLEAVTGLVRDGIDTFVEIAPHPVLLSSLADIAAAAGTPVRTLAGPRRGEPEERGLMALLAALHVDGATVRWPEVLQAGRMVPLPAYPWQRERFWLEDWPDWSGDEAVVGRGDAGSEAPEGVGAQEASWIVEWRPVEGWGEAPAAGEGGWLVAGGGGEWTTAVSDGLRGAGVEVLGIADDPAGLEGLLQAVAASGTAPGGIVIRLDRGPAGVGVPAGSGEVAAPRDPAGDAPAADPSPAHGPAIRALEAVHALLRSGVRAPTWWVTRGAQGPGGRSPSQEGWEQAAAWGLVRTLWTEHPELDAHLVDLDPGLDGSPEDVLRALALGEEPQVAFDGETLHVARLAPAPAHEASALPGSAEGAWLVTGGLGGVGLQVAEELVERGVRRLVLLGRTPLPPRRSWAELPEGPLRDRTEGIRRLEALGASVHPVAVDAGDAGAMEAWLREWRAEGWPEIRGVVHCAGTLDNRLLRDLDEGSLEALLRGKAGAAALLDRLLPEVVDTVYFSSAVAVFPQPGQANYAAANAALDALAASRSAAGRRTVSLGWAVWRDTGMVAGRQARKGAADLARAGVGSFAADEARALFARVAGSRRPHLVLARIDPEAAGRALSGRPGARFYEKVVSAPPPARAAGLLDGLPSGPLRRTELARRLQALVAGILDVPADTLLSGHPLGRQGLDSLMAMELRNRLEFATGLRLQASLAWNHPTLEAMADHLLAEVERAGRGPQVAAPGGPSQAEAGAPGEAALEVPSDAAREEPVQAGAGPGGAAEDPAPADGGGVSRVLSAVQGLSDEEILRQLMGEAP